jgi:hypothetical protein
MTRRRHTRTVTCVTYRRRLTVRHRDSKVHRTVNVGVDRGRRVTLRALGTGVVQMLGVSVTGHGSRIVAVTLRTVTDGRAIIPGIRTRARGARTLVRTIVVTGVHTATCRRTSITDTAKQHRTRGVARQRVVRMT